MTEQPQHILDSNKSDRKTPPAVRVALEALKILAAEDSVAAESLSKLMPAFAMKLSKAGEDVTVENLLEHARQGAEHLTTARTVMIEQKPLTYHEVVAEFKSFTDVINEDVETSHNADTKSTQGPLMDAIWENDNQKVESLLDGGADINDFDSHPLRIAVQFEKFKIAKILLDRGAHLSTHPAYLSYLMTDACRRGHTEMVQLLLDYKIDARTKDDEALKSTTSPEIMHLLINSGVPSNILDRKDRKIYQSFITAKNRWEQIARCEMPQGLWVVNPSYFRPQSFSAVKKMLAAENYNGPEANLMAFAAAALFQTEQRILQYLKKWGAAGKQPLHDIIYSIKAPKNTGVDMKAGGTAELKCGPGMAKLFAFADRTLQYLKKMGTAGKQPRHDTVHFIKAPKDTSADMKAWGDAALKCGPGMAKLFAFADRLPQPEKNADGKTWSYQNTREKVGQFAYARGSEHFELAALCFENTMPEEDFNEALDLVKAQKKNLVKNLPEIVIEGQAFDMEGAVFRLLAANDVRGLVLGELTDCCQSIGGVGADCAEHGFMSENGGFYVVETGNQEILGQTWAWRGEKGELVLDSLETLGERVTDKQWKKLIHAFVKAVAQKPGDVTALHIGSGGGTQKNLRQDFNEASAIPVDYTGYRDSKGMQYQVWKSESYKP